MDDGMVEVNQQHLDVVARDLDWWPLSVENNQKAPVALRSPFGLHKGTIADLRP